jgi:hypothetical protein
VTSKPLADKRSQQTAQIGDIQPALLSQNLTAFLGVDQRCAGTHCEYSGELSPNFGDGRAGQAAAVTG